MNSLSNMISYIMKNMFNTRLEHIFLIFIAIRNIETAIIIPEIVIVPLKIAS